MGDLQWLCEIQKGQRTPRVSFFSGCDSKSKSDCSANFENIPINQVESILDTISNIIQNLQLFNKPTIYYTIQKTCMPTYHIKLVRQCWMGLPNGLGYPLMFRKKNQPANFGNSPCQETSEKQAVLHIPEIILSWFITMIHIPMEYPTCQNLQIFKQWEIFRILKWRYCTI